MKKLIFKFIILLLFIFPSIYVFADSDQNHILVVENLEFDGEEMLIEGYSFISHRDNYGVKNGVGNLNNYLVAYDANYDYILGENNGIWTEDIIDNDGKCINGVPCFSKKLDWTSTVVDLFLGRCLGNEGCTEENRDRWEKVSSSSYAFNEGSCEVDSSNSYCMYHNVGFSDRVNLKKIVSELFNKDSFDLSDGKIKFKIVSIIKNNNGTYKKNSSDVGIHSSLCSVESGFENCVNDSIHYLDNGLYKLKFNGVTNKVYFEATVAAGKIVENGVATNKPVEESICGGTTYCRPLFLDNVYYTALEIGKAGKDIHGIGTFSDTMYKLDSVVVDKPYGSSSKYTLVPTENVTEVCSSFGCNAVGRDYVDYWAYGNWLKLSSSLEITEFKTNYEQINCSDINGGKTNVVNKSTTCDANPNANSEFYQCKALRSENSVSSKIYIKYSESEPECSSYFEEVNGIYYIPVDVKSEVLIEQSGKFHFASLNPETVYAGKYFSIDNISNGISYYNNVRWVFANKIISNEGSIYHNTPYIYYSSKGLYKNINGTCQVDPTYDFHTILDSSFPDVASSKNKIYYRASDDSMKSGNNTLDAVVRSLDVKILNEHLSGYKSSDIINAVKFKSCASNSNLTTCEPVDVGGIWEYDENDIEPHKYIILAQEINSSKYAYRGYGFERDITYNYKLPYAYVSLVDNSTYDWAKIYYSVNGIADYEARGLASVGRKYYVSNRYSVDKFNGFDFPFSLSANSKPSLVSGMEWTLNGTCGVEVEAGLFDIPENPFPEEPSSSGLLYKYRSISLSNPFPKAEVDAFGKLRNVATNWVNWYNEASNNGFSRFANTYNNGIKYSIILSKNSNADNTKVSDVNNINIFYGSMDEINDDGQSDFVNGYNQYKDIIKFNIKESLIPDRLGFCPTGYFSSDCDKYAKTNIGLN